MTAGSADKTRVSSSPSRVVEAVTSGLVAGRYVPGQRLVEADLTRELGVSRGPVREAFKHLAGEGILKITRHRGAFIRALSRDEVHDTLVVLESLTSLAARLAAESIAQSGNRAALTDALDALMALQGQGESPAYFEARRQFYACLIDIGGNGELARMMPQMQINLLRLQFQSYVDQAQRDEHFAEYRAIGEAVLAADAATAERETRKHLRRRREHLITLPESAFLAAAER